MSFFFFFVIVEILLYYCSKTLSPTGKIQFFGRNLLVFHYFGQQSERYGAGEKICIEVFAVLCRNMGNFMISMSQSNKCRI